MSLHTLSDGFNEQVPMSDINVTPLVDVMLVLLIIFMVTAPLLTHAVKIELPRATAALEFNATEEAVLTVARESA